MRSQDPRSQSKQVPVALKWPVHTGISATPRRESPCTFCAHQGVKLLLSESLHLLPRGKTKTKQNTTKNKTKQKNSTAQRVRGTQKAELISQAGGTLQPPPHPPPQPRDHGLFFPTKIGVCGPWGNVRAGSNQWKYSSAAPTFLWAEKQRARQASAR